MFYIGCLLRPSDTCLIQLRACSISLLIALTNCIPATADDSVQITYREKIKHFFAEQEVELHVDITTTAPVKAKVTWALQAAKRPLTRQALELELTPEKPTTLLIKHRLPPLNEGVAFPFELWVKVEAEIPERSTSLTEGMYLYANDMKFINAEKFTLLNLHVFDPPETTVKILDASELHYHRVTNLETLGDFKDGMILVGENTDWSDFGELGSLLLAAAQRGVGVVCLAPAASNGVLPLSLVEKDSRRWSFRRAEVLTSIDKNFNQFWVPGKPSQVHGLRLDASSDQLVAKTVEDAQAWPWLEVEFDEPHKKLVWCGFGIIRDWQQSPLPRRILTHTLFQHLHDRTPPGQAKPFPGYPTP